MSETPMNETIFSELADDLMLAIEEAIEDGGVDIDYETSAGVMTLTIEVNDSKVIVSRQPAMKQIWVAAKSGGYHCDFESGEWRCRTTDESLQTLMSRVCTEQAGEDVSLAF